MQEGLIRNVAQNFPLKNEKEKDKHIFPVLWSVV